MRRSVENRLGRTFLDDSSKIHHRHPVAEVAHYMQVVADEQQSEIKLLTELGEKVDHLRLDGDIERRHRLVRHDEVRLGSERACEGYALTLSARELVWKAVGMGWIEPDLVKEFNDAPSCLASIGETVDKEAVRNLLPDAATRVEAAIRILKDQLHAATQCALDGRWHLRKVQSVKHDSPRTGGAKAQQEAAERALSTT